MTDELEQMNKTLRNIYYCVFQASTKFGKGVRVPRLSRSTTSVMEKAAALKWLEERMSYGACVKNVLMTTGKLKLCRDNQAPI